jgi:hypothetical protein
MTRPAYPKSLALIFIAGAGLALSACASSNTVATPVDTGPAQPRTATYSCADGGNIVIENLGAAIRLLSPDGSAVEYPANPGGQQSRFAQGLDAVVIEGNEALVMHNNQTPITCTR